MSHRPYSQEEKQQALDALEANGGNLTVTSTITGIAISTLSSWRRKYRPNASEPTPAGGVTPSLDLSEDDVQALMNLKHTLLQKAEILADSIESAISEAPLPQRIAGLTQLIDRIMKMSAQLPDEDGSDIDYIIVGADTFERNGDDDDDGGDE